MAGKKCDGCTSNINCYMESGVQLIEYNEDLSLLLEEFYLESELPAGSIITTDPKDTREHCAFFTEVDRDEEDKPLDPVFRNGRWFIGRTGRFALVPLP